MSGLAQIIVMPRLAIAQLRFVIIGRFAFVVSETRAQRIARVFERDEFRPSCRRLCDSIEEAQVARRPDVVDRIAGSFLNQTDRHVARSDDSVERLRRNAKPQHLPVDGRRWSRSVGDEHDHAAAAAKRD